MLKYVLEIILIKNKFYTNYNIGIINITEIAN